MTANMHIHQNCKPILHQKTTYSCLPVGRHKERRLLLPALIIYFTINTLNVHKTQHASYKKHLENWLSMCFKMSHDGQNLTLAVIKLVPEM